MHDPVEQKLRVLTLALTALAVFTLAPFWLPMAFAAWLADLLLPIGKRLETVLRGRRRSAAAVLVIVAIAVLLPVAFVSIAFVGAVREAIEQASVAIQGRGSLGSVILGGAPGHPLMFEDWIDMARRHGGDAWRAATTVAQVSMSFVLAFVVFAVALYNFLAHGPRIIAWLEAYAPMPRDVFLRFANAFRETGRGLIIGNFATALLEGIVATIAFSAMGIPRAFVLGPLTAAAGLLPVLGTAPVWVPLAIGLFLNGDHPRAIAVTVLGIVFGLVDNFLRPVLTRYGRLNLPSFVVLIAMVGGIATFGAAGAILGPLIVRIAVEVLAMARERRSFQS